MPTYEYECTKCRAVLELFQSIKAAPKRFIETNCAQCCNRAPVRRRIGTGGGVIFKGSGFYQTDYRSESYQKAAKADKESSDGKVKSDGGKSESAKDGATKNKPKPDKSQAKAEPAAT